MEIRYDKWYSPALGRDMEIKTYGRGGKPVLYIPCQDGRFYDFENFGMLDAWRPRPGPTKTAIPTGGSAATRTGCAT